MKKSEQIAALKLECDRLAKERDAYRSALEMAHQDMRDLRVRLARRDQTLTDRVRTELRNWRDEFLGAVGL